MLSLFFVPKVLLALLRAYMHGRDGRKRGGGGGKESPEYLGDVGFGLVILLAEENEIVVELFLALIRVKREKEEAGRSESVFRLTEAPRGIRLLADRSPAFFGSQPARHPYLLQAFYVVQGAFKFPFHLRQPVAQHGVFFVQSR